MPPFEPKQESLERLNLIENKTYEEVVAGIEEEVAIHNRLAERAKSLILRVSNTQDLNTASTTVWVKNPDYSMPRSDFYYGIRYSESERFFLLITKLTAPDIQEPSGTIEVEEVVALIGAPVVFRRRGINDSKDENPINYDAHGVADPKVYVSPLSLALELSSEVFINTDDTIAFMELAVDKPGLHYEEPLSV